MGLTSVPGEMERPEQVVRVLYNFEYSKDGRNVWMKEGEALSLLKKTNPDWWQVLRSNERKPFYVPAAYVEEVGIEKPEKKHDLANIPKSETRKSLPPVRDRISDKNLFKEFPGNEARESEKCSDKSEFSEFVSNRTCEVENQDIVLPENEEEKDESRRLLNDKRRSWAAEELVSELTQMAIARSEPVESDYVNLRVDGERFVIAPNEEEEMRMPNSLFWQSSGFVKEGRNNPMSSSDELDNSDSLGQSNCVAWQSKYSLSSEGDKTDESIQSFHSLGNESVSSRHWREDQPGDRTGSSPYAQVICTTSSSSIGTSGLKLSDSLEKLAQQIKFPIEEPSVAMVAPIAPPREYEAPVYENVQPCSEQDGDQDGDEEKLRTLRERLLQSNLGCVAAPQRHITRHLAKHGDECDLGDEQSRDESEDNSEGDVALSTDREEPPLEDSTDREEAPTEDSADIEQAPLEGSADREDPPPEEVAEDAKNEDESQTHSCAPRPGERVAGRPLLEGIVDVKQKIALWNNSGADSERQDRFDEDGQGRPRRVRAFRALGVVKSASESRVSALVNRHGRARPGLHIPPDSRSASRSGSEEFLDSAAGSPFGASPGSEAGAVASMRQRLQLNPEGDNLDASDSGLSNKSDELLDGRRRRTPLMRSRRVESCRRFQRVAPGLGGTPSAPAAPGVPRPQSPPPPSPGQEAARLLSAGWAEFRTADGRSFYYHAATGQRRWKPPRRRPRQDSARSASSSPLQGDEADAEDCDADPPPDAAPGPLPEGWRAYMDPSGQIYYFVHPHLGAKWFSSTDNKGRVYFFEENSCESSWILPDVNSSVTQESTFEDEGCRQVDDPVLSSTPRDDERDRHVKPERSEKQEKLSLRTTKSRSMVIVDSGVNKDIKNIPSPRNWPKLLDDGDMCVLKEGPMYRTKITENGKKLRKNWASSHVVLTELFLLLFRDVKAFAAMKSSNQGIGGPRPELCVDLNGALIDQVDRGDKASVTSRKNVFLVSTVLGLQVLFQCDCSQQAEEWFNAVHTAIHNLPSGFDSCPRLKVTKEMDRLFAESHSPEQTKKFPRIGRSKSVKIKNKDGSIEDLTVSVAERQTKIRARLKKFFNRRPTMEFLVKKGIWKDEPAFGSYLEQVCGSETPKVPMFVQRCIAVIESIEENMKTDGLYRVSGNLSQVQKIRLQVDQNNLSALDQEEDVHVLTGALKLFFRELKEPLIPYAAFSKAIKASTLQNKKEKLAQFREIVKSLPTANHDTLKMLLKHLLKVTGYQEFNRMHIPNLAIVFGPTLMWPEQESLNMALDLMQQNLVIEAFLLDFDNIFR
ncbi:rho GTPase-activating protein 12 isoform X2 [Frankliniella occidentalis]|uniref:Rho GTPase-activating protein 12 isoform X2 n=1 Tax=Frankliniella occidentalis TaxID=133901 RepID=A0A9C6WPV7_FRAOC|nr:rho GTPase-activating protein 12 isoform X2 [Frankliniella occidentalis]